MSFPAPEMMIEGGGYAYTWGGALQSDVTYTCNAPDLLVYMYCNTLPCIPAAPSVPSVASRRVACHSHTRDRLPCSSSGLIRSAALLNRKGIGFRTLSSHLLTVRPPLRLMIWP